MAKNQASVDSGRSIFSGGSGRWATERLLKAANEGRQLSAQELRTNDTLRRDEWIFFDTQVVEAAAERLVGVADLIAAGLTLSVPNSLGKTVFGFERITDMDPATESLDGISRTPNDRIEFELSQVPLPMVHKDFHINLRVLAASRSGGQPLDTLQIRLAGRVIAEKQEDRLFNGGKTFGGLTTYGYTNHPDRNQVTYEATGDAWSNSGKTGAQIVADVFTMKAAAAADGYFGPYWVYVSRDAENKLGEDYKSESDKTIRQRISEIEGISSVKVSDRLATGNTVLVQATSDVVQWIQGEPLQTIQWDLEGGFQINFKAFEIASPLIRSDVEGNSGVVHMTVAP